MRAPDIIEIPARPRYWPRLLMDSQGSVYLAPNCYCVVDLKTGKTMNRPGGLVEFEGSVMLFGGEAA